MNIIKPIHTDLLKTKEKRILQKRSTNWKLEYCLNRYAYILRTKMYFDLIEGKLLTPEYVKLKRPLLLREAFFRSSERKLIRDMVFSPKQAPLVYKIGSSITAPISNFDIMESLTNEDGFPDIYLNSWHLTRPKDRTFTNERNEISKFLDAVSSVDSTDQYFLNWAAHMIQCPEEKCSTVPQVITRDFDLDWFFNTITQLASSNSMVYSMTQSHLVWDRLGLKRGKHENHILTVINPYKDLEYYQTEATKITINESPHRLVFITAPSIDLRIGKSVRKIVIERHLTHSQQKFNRLEFQTSLNQLYWFLKEFKIDYSVLHRKH